MANCQEIRKQIQNKMQFQYSGERFADLQMLRYKLPGFEELTARQKAYVYYLSEATLWGRDITFDQYGRYNLLIRKTLEEVFRLLKADNDTSPEAEALVTYLKRVWFSNGIYHHYGCDKFKPEFPQAYFVAQVRRVAADRLPMPVDKLLETIVPVMFDETLLPKRVNKTAGEDLVKTSACNFYEGVTQKEVEEFYAAKKQDNDPCPPSYGLNSVLKKDGNGELVEEVWCLNGKYGKTIAHIVE